VQRVADGYRGRAGAYVNVIPARELTSLQGATNGIPALATLIVTAAPPVTLAKAFAPSSVVVGGTSVLTLTIGNAATGAVALTNLAVSDALPRACRSRPRRTRPRRAGREP